MADNRPKVSIGLPVYNGEKFLEDAIDSILAQNFTDFELIITDNASTDQTENICKSYAAKDKRVRYIRNVKNLGLAKNFQLSYEQSSGKYFKWAAHDDTIAPDYLEKCVNILEKDESVVLCYSKTILIDTDGNEIGKYKVTFENTLSSRPQDRFKDLVTISHWGSEIFGLLRSDVLRKTPLIAGFPGSDRTLIAELSLLGRFYEIPEYIFFSRSHSDRSIETGTVHSRGALFDPSKENVTIYPHWRQLLEYFKSVGKVQLSFYQRAVCYLHLVRSVAVNIYWARMLMDLAMAVEPRSWDFVVGIKRKLENKNILKKA